MKLPKIALRLKTLPSNTGIYKFYDKAGNKIEERLNLKRGECRKTFCDRTLQKMDDPRWNHLVSHFPGSDWQTTRLSMGKQWPST